MDNLDYGILDMLRQNSRAGYGDIGERVGLSASAVKRRVDRLVADGVIRAFTIQVDPAVDGMGTEAYVELFCRGTVAPRSSSASSRPFRRSSTRAPSPARPTRSSTCARATSR